MKGEVEQLRSTIHPSPFTLHPRSSSLVVQAHAKINLYLAVAGTRPDGFHELATIFARVALADELVLTPQPRGVTCRCDHPDVPQDETNLAARAAQLLLERSGVQRGVAITVHKRIPVAAGLGGGSSDAATVLTALNRWWQLGLSHAALLDLGRQLGADVPFFVTDVPHALGVGRGDVIVPLPVMLPLWHVLVTPPMTLSTASVFQTWDTLGSAAGTANVTRLTRLLAALLQGDGEAARSLFWNQLTPAAARLAPVIQEAEDALTQCGARIIHLSGSGPTLVATTLTAAEAEPLAARVSTAHPQWRVLVTHTWFPEHDVPNTSP